MVGCPPTSGVSGGLALSGRSPAYLGFLPIAKAKASICSAKSLVSSNQLPDGINMLEKALDAYPAGQAEIHHLLARSYFDLPQPLLQQAEQHNDDFLKDTSLAPQQRGDGTLLRAEILAGLGRYEQARSALSSIPAAAERRAWVQLLSGQIMLGEIQHTRQQAVRLPENAEPTSPPLQLAEAMRLISEAESLDKLDTEVSRRAMYLLGTAHLLEGDQTAALEQFTKTRKRYGATPEGLAAALSEAELLQHAKRHDDAAVAFRRVLEAVVDPGAYRSPMLPLPTLRQRILLGLERMALHQRFADGLATLEHFPPLFNRIVQEETRAKMLEQWGSTLLDLAQQERHRADDLRHSARRQLREAGVVHERLAKLRFATETYTSDLWNSAENFYQGQSYSGAIRILEEYLRYEAVQRNPQALLRLGQSHLALGHVDRSIAGPPRVHRFPSSRCSHVPGAH